MAPWRGRHQRRKRRGATLTETADSGPGPAEAPAAAVSGPFDKAAIAARVAELAREISEVLPEAFTVVGLLKGSFVFVDDLVRAPPEDIAGRAVLLLDSPVRRAVAVPLDFIGFALGGVFVVGYGIDHAEQYRYPPYLGAIEWVRGLVFARPREPHHALEGRVGVDRLALAQDGQAAPAREIERLLAHRRQVTAPGIGRIAGLGAGQREGPRRLDR